MRYSSFGRNDSVGFVDGDGAWIGIDSTRDRDKAARGMLYKGENTRLRTGTAKQRPGTLIPPDFNPTAGLSPPLAGSGIFRDPNGDEILLVAPKNQTYTIALEFGKDSYQIDYSTTTNAPTGNNGNGSVQFVQTFDSVHLLRKPIQNNENLVWNGNTPTSDANRWQHTVLSADGNTLIPGRWKGEPWGDRSIFYFPLWGSAPNRDS